MNPDGPVVVALDGSAHSAQTLRWGIDEAALRGAPAVLTRSYQEPRDLSEWGWYPYLSEDLHLDEEARTYLAEQVEQESTRHPSVPVTGRLLHGPPVPLLRELSADAQLLVVGAGSGTGRLRLGSVSGHLAAHARCPVAVVRGPAPGDTAGVVVVGVDGSRPSVAAAQVAASEAALRDVPLVVVHARPTIAAPYGSGATPPPLAGVDADQDDPAHRGARLVADDLRAAHTELQVSLLLVDDDPAHALVTAAEEAQLVVVGSRGLGGFRGMLLGSVSSEVVRRASTTVLVARDAATD